METISIYIVYSDFKCQISEDLEYIKDKAKQFAGECGWATITEQQFIKGTSKPILFYQREIVCSNKPLESKYRLEEADPCK